MISKSKSPNAKTLLSIKDISVQFGGLKALDRVNLEIEFGARYGILGPNGAGKTTLFNTLSGFVPPSEGEMILNSVKLNNMQAHDRVSVGLSRTFQITTLFPELSVLENVLMASQVFAKKHKVFWRAATSDELVMSRVTSLLEDLNLINLANNTVKELSYGEQRLLEIAVALASNPKILLLDEPTAGLSSAEIHSVVRLIQGLPKNLTILMIEHDLDVIFDITEQLSVLHFGKMIAQGSTEEIRNNKKVKEVYLGEA